VNKKPLPFVFAWRGAMIRSNLPDALVRIGLAFAEYGDSDGTNCRPSVPRIATELSRSDRTIQRATKRLVREGWFVVDRRGGGRGTTTHYRLAIPSSPDTKAASIPAANADTAQGVTLAAREPRHGRAENGDSRSREPRHPGVTRPSRPSPDLGTAREPAAGSGPRHAGPAEPIDEGLGGVLGALAIRIPSRGRTCPHRSSMPSSIPT
jgi:hypothetical protein